MIPLLRTFLIASSLIVLLLASSEARKPRSPAQRFFMKPDIEYARVSPGNQYLSYVGYNGSRVLMTYEFETGKRRSIQADHGNDVYDHYWVSRNQLLVFAEKLGLPAQVFTTSNRLRISQPSEYVEVYDLLPDVANKLIVKDTGPSEKFFHLDRFDPTTGSRKRVARNPGHIVSWFTDKDGIVRIRLWIDENEKDRFDYRSSRHTFLRKS
jgi:hypothetical protein